MLKDAETDRAEAKRLLLDAGIPESEIDEHALMVSGFVIELVVRLAVRRMARRILDDLEAENAIA